MCFEERRLLRGESGKVDDGSERSLWNEDLLRLEFFSGDCDFDRMDVSMGESGPVSVVLVGFFLGNSLFNTI